MAKMIETEEEGKTVEEAIKKAMERLNARREDLKIEVIDEGKSGLLGFGAKPAKIRVIYDALLPIMNKASQILEGIISRMGISATIEASKRDNNIILNIKSEMGGLLIGKGGETIDAFQHLLARIFNEESSENVHILVDTGDYRKRKEQNLRRMAVKYAKTVKETGKPYVFEEMNSHDRRIIHMALQNDPNVKTQSLGNGLLKKVQILPVKNQRKNKSKRKYTR